MIQVLSLFCGKGRTMHFKLLQSWLQHSESAQRSRRPVRLSFRPQCEALEDRLTMSANPAINVTTHNDELTGGDGKTSLREAINIANTRPGPDTIVLSSGIYKMTVAGTGDDANATGDFDIS